ncbi:TatD family hydrolase [Clostridium bornimense]|uniref:TatD family hydrolase n=1 Tax=Clostridium bornimense TaxID=1216932 RepID=W6RZS2_9CLOT|nr:TatD family hydrolase [Clostridium bornimense]CDM67512.1 TatD family hydrolase [Clostridium bornimense]
MKIFDTHSHYDDEAFDGDREELIKIIIENDVVGIINCAADMKSVKSTIELTKKYPMFYGAIGVHPCSADEINEETIEELRMAAKNEKIVAIGEIGLDYYYEDNPSREIQKNAFRAQMQLAKELSKPVIIHIRDAHEDALKILEEFEEVRGIIHCFSGSVEIARKCVKIGYMLGIGGVVTFKNARKLVEVVKEIPMENLLLETDCPYMAPVPHRGERNNSMYISEVIKKIAEIKSISEEEVADIALRNSHNFTKNIW